MNVGAMSEAEGTEMFSKLLSIDEVHPEDTLDLLDVASCNRTSGRLYIREKLG